MRKKRDQKTSDKVESLTKSLLECFEELSLIYRVLPEFILALDIKKIQEDTLDSLLPLLKDKADNHLCHGPYNLE